MNAKRIAASWLLLTLAAAPAEAVVIQQTYQIHAGGSYTYKPSPFGGAIPGGVPSNLLLSFGVGGTFDYRYDTAGPTGTLLNLNLFLTGNEPIQAAPPGGAPVTADRVETYLANQTFVTDFIGGLVHLKSSTVPGLKLTDGLNGNVAIHGGYDNTFVDGDGMQFQFSAVTGVIPEPGCIPLAATSVLALLHRRRR